MILLYLALAYFSGIAIGHWLWQRSLIDCGFPTWLWIAPMLALPPLLWWERTRPVAASVDLRWPRSAGFEPLRPAVTSLVLGAVGLSAVAGMLRYAGHPLSPCWTEMDLAFYNAAQDAGDVPLLTVIGSVISYPTVNDGRQRLQVEVESIVQQGEARPVTGRVQLSAPPLPRYQYGQRMEIRGQLVDPPIFEKFDYRAYLARKGVHSQLQRPRIELLPGDDGNPLLRGIYALRARGEALLNRLLPEPYAALANGMLLGIESGIPDDLYEQFNLTGTSHVIVISGWNVTQKW